MWKFQDTSVNQTFCEINFEESRSSKSAVFAILGSLKIVNLLNFNLLKLQKFIKSNFRASKFVKMLDFALLESPKLVNDRNS